MKKLDELKKYFLYLCICYVVIAVAESGLLFRRQRVKVRFSACYAEQSHFANVPQLRERNTEIILIWADFTKLLFLLSLYCSPTEHVASTKWSPLKFSAKILFAMTKYVSVSGINYKIHR